MAGPCYTVAWQRVVDKLYTTEAMAIATTVCSLVSLTVGCTIGYSVATYRRSTVRDVINHQTSWTDSRQPVTKSQLIAVLNQRNVTDLRHNASKPTCNRPAVRHELTAYRHSSTISHEKSFNK